MAFLRYDNRVPFIVIALTVLAGCGGAADRGAKTGDEAPRPSAADIASAIDDQRARFSDAATAGDGAANAHQFTFDGLMTETIPLAAFKGEVMLVVNTASRCGFTPQYRALQSIHEDYADRGFSVLGVPSNDFGDQEPGSAAQIREFCELNYGVTFPLAAKTAVTGAQAHDFYVWAVDQHGSDAAPRWNFHKILIDRRGEIADAFPSKVEPDSAAIRTAIETLL